MRSFLSVFALLLLGAVSAQRTTILDVIQGDSNYSTLALAINIADIGETLDCGRFFCRTYTLFAPINSAFDALPAETLTTLTTNEEYRTHLRQLLFYHIIFRELPSSSIVDGAERLTLQGETITTNITDGNIFINGDAEVVDPDMSANNGIIHGINAVLLPSFITDDIVSILQRYNDRYGPFDSLLSALNATGLDSALEGEGPFTLFAPTDRAFEALGASTLDGLFANTTALSEILLYHVVAGEIIVASELTDGEITTLEGSNITVTRKGFFFRYPVLNENVFFVAFNILASNGVIHIITEVLIPPSDPSTDPTITQLAIDTPSLSTLVTAVVTAGLDGVLANETAALTVFAPDNDAFDDLGDAVAILLNNTDLLTNLLTYHVVTSTLLRSDLEDTTLAALNGDTIDVDVSRFFRRVILNDASRVLSFDNIASNGVVHIISNVLIPPSTLPVAALLQGFPTLYTALERANLMSALEQPGPFTVFAPTESAFQNVQGLDALLDDAAALSNILLYHVVSGKIRGEDLSDGTLTTLQDSDITIELQCIWIFCFGAEINGNVDIRRTDIMATNGIIHAIDAVLIPPS